MRQQALNSSSFNSLGTYEMTIIKFWFLSNDCHEKKLCPVSQSLSQWVMCVSCSWLNVVSSLQGLLSSTVPERQGGSGAGHNTRPQRCYSRSPVMLLLLFSPFRSQRSASSLQTAAKSHTYFKRALPLIPPVLLQLATDSSA